MYFSKVINKLAASTNLLKFCPQVCTRPIILQYLHYVGNTYTAHVGIQTHDHSAITVSSYHELHVIRM